MMGRKPSASVVVIYTVPVAMLSRFCSCCSIKMGYQTGRVCGTHIRQASGGPRSKSGIDTLRGQGFYQPSVYSSLCLQQN